ncbi:MAG: FtsW/RodA/SpoVE family cell cycle protein [Patescibacteria group bacterium]
MQLRSLPKSKDKTSFSLEKILFPLSIFLALLGLFFVFEASTTESYNLVGHQYHFLKQQSIALFLGLTVAVIIRFWSWKFWQQTSLIWFLVGLLLLLLVLIPGFGVELNGARRWFAVGGRVFQPVEFFKFALILFSAHWMAKNPKPQTFMFFTAIFSLLLLLQPDMGSLLILLVISFGMFFLAGGNLRFLVGISSFGIALLTIAILLSPYRLQRLTTYLDPSKDPLGAGFHIRQITLALGHGGWFGVGIGNSQQKHAYIPEASSDSIFAIVSEEVGFIGSSLILLLMIFYLLIIYRLASSFPEKSFEQLLIFGIFLWFGGQILLNISAVVALVPLTGLPLPFFSYGGTSILMTFIAVGLMMAAIRSKETQVSVRTRKKVQ